MTNQTWQDICAADDVEDGMKLFTVDRRKIVVSVIDERYFAFSALCPHAAGPMERAEVFGNRVTCPLHGWIFDLDADGAETHGCRSLPTFQTRVVDGRVQVFI